MLVEIYCMKVKTEYLAQHIVNIESGEKITMFENIVSSTDSRLNIIAYSESDESITSSNIITSMFCVISELSCICI